MASQNESNLDSTGETESETDPSPCHPSPPSHPQKSPKNVDYLFKNSGLGRTFIDGRNLPSDLRFSYPHGLTYHEKNDEIYLADFSNSRVMIYNSAGTEGRVFCSDVPGVRDVKITDDNRVIVLQETCLSIMTNTGQLVREIHTEDAENVSVIVFNKHIAVLDIFHKLVKIFTDSGDFVRTICYGYLVYPRCMTVDDEGNLYITDGEFSCVKKFNWDGEFLKRYAEMDRNFNVWGVCVDGDGSTSVARYHDGNIDVYNSECGHVTTVQLVDGVFETSGAFVHPYSVCLMGDGRMIVSEWNDTLKLINNSTDQAFIRKQSGRLHFI